MFSKLSKLGTCIRNDKTQSTIFEGEHYASFLIEWRHISGLIKNWSHNRPHDQKRVEEMELFYMNGGRVPFYLFVAELKTEGLVCYDGNHRRNLLLSLNDGSLNVIIDVMFDATEDKIHKALESLNKSVPLPSLYIDKSLIKVKPDILRLVKKYEDRYPKLKSESSNCHRPHFNRDTFCEDIGKIYLYYKNNITPNSELSVLEIEKVLQHLNLGYKNQKYGCIHKDISDKILQKCEVNGLWLFIKDRNVTINDIERVNEKLKYRGTKK